MSYLNRDERREVILQAAMRVALAEGFTAMTVRRIASEADVAAGQVHHHFSSAGELKALAFVHLIRTLLDAGQVPPPATWRARLHAMLGSEDGGFEPYIKLWREAQILADRDPHIRDAYLLTMQMWHEETVTIIEQGKQAGEFTFTAKPRISPGGLSHWCAGWTVCMCWVFRKWPIPRLNTIWIV